MIPSSIRPLFLNLFLVISTIFLTGIEANAQYFEKTYGNNDKTSGVLFTTTNNGYVILGNTIDSVLQTSGYYLLSIDSNGSVLWEKKFVDLYHAFGYSITTLKNGKIEILGTHTGPVYQIVAELKELDSVGNILDSAIYPPFNGWGTAGVAMTNTSDSSVAISLYNDGFISNNFYSVFSLNPDLSTKWSDFIGFDGSFTNAHGISAIPDNNVYTIVYYDNYFYSPTALFRVTSLRKHNSNGGLLLDSLYEFNCVTTGVTATNDGGALICGTQDTSAQKNIVLIRLDSTGNVLWKKMYGNFKDEETNAVIESSDGGIILLTTVADTVIPGQHDLMLLKTDANGDSLWSRYFGGALDERGLHLEEDDGDLAILGSTRSFGKDHIYFIKTDSSGIIRTPYNIISSGRYFCDKDTAVLQLNPPPSPDLHIAWSNGDTINPARVTVSGNYFAILTDTLGHSTQTPIVPVYFSTLPHVWIGPDTLFICQGTALSDTFPPELTNSYQWYFNGQLLLNEISNHTIPQQAGLYQLVVSNYCSQDTGTSFIHSFYLAPSQPIVTAPSIDFVCPGDSLPLSIVPEVSISYQWFITDYFTKDSIPGAIDSVYYVHDYGQYLVRATNLNGCSVFSDVLPVSYDHDQVFVNPGGPTHFCEGGEVVLSVPIGTDYLWSNGDTTQSITTNTSGDYFVSFININGCFKSSDTLTINILPNPVITLGPDTILCSDSTLVLDPGSGFTNYFWQDESFGQTFLASSGGPFPDSAEYFVAVTDSNGCTDADTLNIVFDICQGIHEAVPVLTRIFPNPLRSGEASELFNPRNESLTVVISDMMNREIIRKQADYSSKIYETSHLPAGIYHYTIYRDKKPQSSGKLIIQ